MEASESAMGAAAACRPLRLQSKPFEKLDWMIGTMISPLPYACARQRFVSDPGSHMSLSPLDTYTARRVKPACGPTPPPITDHLHVSETFTFLGKRILRTRNQVVAPLKRRYNKAPIGEVGQAASDPQPGQTRTCKSVNHTYVWKPWRLPQAPRCQSSCHLI